MRFSSCCRRRCRRGIPEADFLHLKRAITELADNDTQRSRQHPARPSCIVQGLEPPQRSAHASALGVARVLSTLRRAADADHADVRVSARPSRIRRTYDRRRRRHSARTSSRFSGPASRASATCLPRSFQRVPMTQGLPIGVQIVGPEYGDLATIEVAQILEQRGFAFRSPPGY